MKSIQGAVTHEERCGLNEQLLNSTGKAMLAVCLDGTIVTWNAFAEKRFGWTAEEATGRNIDIVLGARNLLKSIQSEIEKVQGEGGWTQEFEVKSRDGKRLSARFTLGYFQNERRAFITLVGGEDPSEHPETRVADLEQRVNDRTLELRKAIEQLKQSESMIQTLFRLSTKLNSTLNVGVILDELAQEAIKVVGGESGFAGLHTAEGMQVWKYFMKGKAIPFEYVWPADRGIPSWVLQNKVPYGTSDAANDPYMQHELSINADVRSIVCTPILDSSGEVLAYFDIRNKMDSEGFTISDQDMLMAIAPVASIAIQNALAYQQRLATVAELKESSKELQALAAKIESAREEERAHISRELHDQLGQALTAMKFDLAWLTRKLKREDAQLGQKAKTITTQMDTMIKTVRRISTELRSGMLDDIGLVASIEWQSHDFAKRTGIACIVISPDEELNLDRAQSLALFRIFQEALTNVSRHAKAKHVEVKLTAEPDSISLQIHDDGTGIRRQDVSGSHSLGLLGMSERAKRLGGKFEVFGFPGEGTTIIVTLPRSQAEDTNQNGEIDA